MFTVMVTGSRLMSWLADQAGDTQPAVWERFLPLLIAIGIPVLSLLAGRWIARWLRLPDVSTRLGIILALVLCAVAVILTKWPPRFGVDLQGGINMIGQLDLDAFGRGDNLAAGDRRPEARDIIPTLRQRVDPAGTREIVIRPLGKDKIEVIMPKVELPEAMEIWNRLAMTGHLQFRILADSRFNSGEMNLASDLAAKGSRGRNVVERKSDGTEVIRARWYDLAREVTGDAGTPGRSAPVKFVPSLRNLVRDRDTGQLINMGQVPMGRGEPGEAFAAWLDSKGIRHPQILMLEPASERMNVEGEHLSTVSTGFDDRNRPCIHFALKGVGARRMGALTTAYKPRSATEKYQLGIVLDDALHSAPEIEEPIFSRGRIMGTFTRTEVENLKINLDSGKISVALVKTPISHQFLESTLGAELKSKGLWTIAASLLIVLLFMLYYYRLFAGGVSCVALILNVVLTLGFVMAINQPLTLTGLAGLVLTIGMSVDANVLVFERMREELGRGSSLRLAIQNGFDRALGTIIDSNVTTLLTAVVLYVLGTDQIKGFSVTLIVGILTSMFTAVFVSRTLFGIAERKRWVTGLNFAQAFRLQDWDFMARFRPAAIASIVLIAIGLVCLFSLGKRILDIDLRGGSTAQVIFNDQITRPEIEKILASSRITHNGEPVDFIVSSVDDPDPQRAGRVFKIDSNIPSNDESTGERWKELNEVLTDVFAGRLRLHHVTVPGKISAQQVGEGTSIDGSRAGGRAGVSRLDGGAGSLAGGLLDLQDEAVSGTQDPGAAEGETPSSDGPEPVRQEGDPARQDSVPPAAAEPPAGNADQQPGDDGNSGPGQLAAGRTWRASFDLEFQDPVTAKSLRTQLVEMARRMDRGVEEPDVLLNGAGPGESADALSATKWNVTMNTAGPDDADAIVQAWSQEFNKLTYFQTAGGVGGQIAASTQVQALAAVLASLLGIIAYIWVRFQNIAFGIAAVVALIHDVLVVLGAIAISHYVAGALGFLLVDKFKISLQIIAALLTVIGYSLNDTIVIFDRIREVRGKRIEMNSEIVNKSVSQTLSRTILTSLTTLMVVVLLYAFGGPSIHGFAFSLVVGVIAGTYSTIFVASPVLVWLMNRWGLNAELNAELDVARS